MHRFIIERNINIVQWISQGFGGGAPNKLKASAEGRGASFVSDPCRRHGRKLVNNINVAEEKRPKKDEKVGQPLVSHLSAKVGK